MDNPVDPAWRATRDTLHVFSRILGKVRQSLTPAQKHWGHISLRTWARGLTTTPVPGNKDLSLPGFECQLDLCDHLWILQNGAGEQFRKPLRGWTPSSLVKELSAALSRWGIEPGADFSVFSGTHSLDYDPEAARVFWNYFSKIDLLFKEFRGGLREACSPVQLWPHHFDLSFSWFSGRRVPGQDPTDEENADEQMTFGFSTGDQGIPEAYFYVTAYPTPAGWLGRPLPSPARWREKDWKGALLLFKEWRSAPNPRGHLLDFLGAVHSAGKKRME